MNLPTIRLAGLIAPPHRFRSMRTVPLCGLRLAQGHPVNAGEAGKQACNPPPEAQNRDS